MSRVETHGAWVEVTVGSMPFRLCGRCGLNNQFSLVYPLCPFPWGDVKLEGKTPLPGGLDRLGVVKELRPIKDAITNCIVHADEKKWIASTEALLRADYLVQQLISRLDGQRGDETGGADNSGRHTHPSEPEGQYGELRKQQDPRMAALLKECEDLGHDLGLPFSVDPDLRHKTQVCRRCGRGFVA